MNEQTNLVETIKVKEFDETQIVYNITEEGICALEAKYKDVPDCNDPENYEIVRVGIRELVSLRTSVEKRRAQLKKPSWDFGKKVDKVAGVLDTRITALELPMKDAKAKVDDEKQAEKDRLAQEEIDRASNIRMKINLIKEFAVIPVNFSSEQVIERIEKCKTSFNVTEDEYEEHFAEAEVAMETTVAQMEKTLEQVKEAEAQREADRIERERLDDERAKFEADRLKEREEQEKRLEERRKVEEEDAKKREEEQRKIDEENDRIAKENERIAEENRLLEQKKEDQRLEDLRRERDEEDRKLKLKEEEEAAAEKERLEKEAEAKRVAEEKERKEKHQLNLDDATADILKLTGNGPLAAKILDEIVYERIAHVKFVG